MATTADKEATSVDAAYDTFDEYLRLAIKEYERPLDQGPRQFNNRAAIGNALRKSLAKAAA